MQGLLARHRFAVALSSTRMLPPAAQVAVYMAMGTAHGKAAGGLSGCHHNPTRAFSNGSPSVFAAPNAMTSEVRSKHHGLVSNEWFGLRDDLLQALGELNIKHPSRVQAAAIPAIAAGADVNVQAATGTGKTLSYLLPLFHRLKEQEDKEGIVSRPGRPRALVIVPTRELALQVTAVAKGLCHSAKLSVAALVGGRKESSQKSLLERPVDLLIGTPGTIASAVGWGLEGAAGAGPDNGKGGAKAWPSLALGDIRMLVLDEVDTLLDERQGAMGSRYVLNRRRDDDRRGVRGRSAQGPGQGDLDPDRGFLPSLQAILQPLEAVEEKAARVREALLDGRQPGDAAAQPVGDDGQESSTSRRLMGEGQVQVVLVGATLPPHALKTIKRMFPSVRPAAEVTRELEQDAAGSMGARDASGRRASGPLSSATDPLHLPPETIRHDFIRVGPDPHAKHAGLMEALSKAVPPGTHREDGPGLGMGMGGQDEIVDGADLGTGDSRKRTAALAKSLLKGGQHGSNPSQPRRALVFCNTIASARYTAYYLGEQGYSVSCLHGGIPPQTRSAEYQLFISGEAPVLVATDAAARGLDIPHLSVVVMFDFPLAPVEYVHRAGRAGRAGMPGRVFSLVGPGDGVLATAIERAVTTRSSVDLLSLTADKGQYVPRGQREAWRGGPASSWAASPVRGRDQARGSSARPASSRAASPRPSSPASSYRGARPDMGTSGRTGPSEERRPGFEAGRGRPGYQSRPERRFAAERPSAYAGRSGQDRGRTEFAGGDRRGTSARPPHSSHDRDRDGGRDRGQPIRGPRSDGQSSRPAKTDYTVAPRRRTGDSPRGEGSSRPSSGPSGGRGRSSSSAGASGHGRPQAGSRARSWSR